MEDLSQQLSAKGAELEKERKESAAGAERVKALKVELGAVRESVMRKRRRKVKRRRQWRI